MSPWIVYLVIGQLTTHFQSIYSPSIVYCAVCIREDMGQWYQGRKDHFVDWPCITPEIMGRFLVQLMQSSDVM